MKMLVSEKNSPEFNRAVFIPQHKMNAFPDEIPCYGRDSRVWKEGDFVVHFAGAWAHVKGDDPYGDLMRKYEVYTK
jgi:mannan polymerase II complex MNN10 subunit